MQTAVPQNPTPHPFAMMNRAYKAVFQPERLSVGLVVPIEAYPNGPVPSMRGQLDTIVLAERLGFSAVWLRDVPFNVPTFGDAGQTFDPFVYLGLLAGRTSRIALGVASIILPLRHPAHVAKAAMSVDALSEGRLLLGVASGDRPEEYPALGLNHAERGERFRAGFEYIRRMCDDWPRFENAFGRLDGHADMLPKPTAGALPMLITGGSQQDADWLARNGDGWMIYPRAPQSQAKIVGDWRARSQALDQAYRPAMQPLYVDVVASPPKSPEPIHLGWRLGVEQLAELLLSLQAAGMNHVALNLRFNQAGIEQTLERLARDLLPIFDHATTSETKT